uniref:RNA polymerase sigma factor n=1 Tax=Magnetococcus massalia (strain MO-1) TaxID=451514 RepID=A0A1S7LMB8_MAGMO|nr:RNA polymerase sigma factor [Candidatus Magnetococcus massalia]
MDEQTRPDYMVNDPDAELLHKALDGDCEAYGRVVRRLQTRVYHFILRHIDSTDDAQDLTQETFLEAYRNLSRFQGHSLFSTWILGIAHNMSRNFRGRAPHYKYNIVDDSALEKSHKEGEDPQSLISESARIQALKQAMGALPDDQREALTLVSLEELSYEEAAQVAGISLSALKTRVFRARRRLRDLLKSSGELELFE